jgi:RNA polymerase sigma-70 factor (ECF subfamily)
VNDAPDADAAARAAAVSAARSSYGRLLAWLARQWRDIAAAEDALADAFVSALDHWPREGVPASPEGWLMTAAKRNLLKDARHRRVAADPALTLLFDLSDSAAPEAAAIPDDRLRLMFVCAHPAIEPTLRTALMLQTVLGIEAARIAQAHLVPSETMAKRLVRVKAKIKANGLRFEEPDPQRLGERVVAVLDAIYGAYTLHWGLSDGAAGGELAEEALYLAALVAAQLPHSAEALGLHALLLGCEARRGARLDDAGEFVPLDRQDARRWDPMLIVAANRRLAEAAALAEPGPYQIEAAIQSAHNHRASGGATPWADIVVLYERLLALAPTVGARIGHAMALSRAVGTPRQALALLDAIDVRTAGEHQPWWAARAQLLALAGDHDDAASAYRRALALTREPALRCYFEKQLGALPGEPAPGGR